LEARGFGVENAPPVFRLLEIIAIWAKKIFGMSLGIRTVPCGSEG
jgi:hypothetical protein